MNVNQIHQPMPTMQHEQYKTMEQVVKGEVPLLNSQRNTSEKETMVDPAKLKTTVEKLNDMNDPERTNLKFEYHEDLHEYYVTVVNPKTKEVIREIPPREMLDMYAAMAKHMGILVDETV